MNKEPSSPKSLQCKIWSAAHSKPKKNNWHYMGARQRSAPREIAPVVKMVGKGKYQIGNFEPASLDEIKEFMRMKGLQSVRMGAIVLKAA